MKRHALPIMYCACWPLLAERRGGSITWDEARLEVTVAASATHFNGAPLEKCIFYTSSVAIQSYSPGYLMETKEHNSGVHQQKLIEREQTYALNKLLPVIVTLNG